jgi:hypothetical protein
MRKYRWVLLLLIIWLLPALACSLPRAEPERQLPSFDEALLERGYFLATPETENISEPDPAPLPPAPPLPTDVPSLVHPVVNVSAPPASGVGLPPVLYGDEAVYSYPVQSGDTLPVVARRFGVESDQITSSQDIPAAALLSPGQVLEIPNLTGPASYPAPLLPDSAVVFFS